MNNKSRADEEVGDLTYYVTQYDFKLKYSPGKKTSRQKFSFGVKINMNN